MSYSDILTPRRDVLSDDGIEGIIDLANLQEKKRRRLENTPETFFDLTYPTKDIRRVIQQLHERFKKDSSTPGLFLLEGLKGSGKSHLLLLIYHLFSNPDKARPWLERHQLECMLPSDPLVIINKFTDLPLDSIWGLIFEKLSEKPTQKGGVQPGLPEIEKILNGQRLVLILDELEQGIRVIPDPAMRAQNIAFLQMLSEWSNRSNQVTLFCSIYSDQEEPGSTLKRVPACRVQFAHSPDKTNVVLHRLFQNYLEMDPLRISGIIESYINHYRRHITFNADEYRNRMAITYPFLPEFIELILDRVPVRGGFQNVRGALGFLAHMVRRTHGKTDWITAAHASLRDQEITTRLADLDASGLINNARSDLDDLKTLPLSDEISATIMLYTLTGSTGRLKGVTKEELLRHVLTLEEDINEFERSLLALQKYASHFWCHEGRYYFDLEENPDAKIEFYSLRFSDDVAREWLAKLWKEEIFREPQAAVMMDIEKTKELLDSMDKTRLRYILASRRLTPVERHDLYYGLQNRNLIIMLEPRDATFDLGRHPDLLKWAKRSMAAAELSGMTKDSERKSSYERIGREDKRTSIDTISRAGLIFIRWEHYDENPKSDRIEEESISGVSKENVLNALSQQYFPQQLFEEHIGSRLNQIMGQTVKTIAQEYSSTLGFPVPVMLPRSINNPIRFLCRLRYISLRHNRGNFCGEDPSLSETELLEATIDQPFETTATVTPTGPVRPIVPTGPVIKPPVPAVGRLEEISLPPQISRGVLRQEIATRLQKYPQGKITRIRFMIYSEQTTGDLSTLPSTFRGTLSGPGDLSAEIRVTKEGEFSKSEVEGMAEALPMLPRCEYSAQLTILIPPASGEGGDG